MNNLCGQVYGKLTVIARGDRKGSYFCKCECGKDVKTHKANLLRGRAKSCGCSQYSAANERTKEKFLARTDVDLTLLGWDAYNSKWDVRCVCGVEKQLETADLMKNKSCGCNRWKRVAAARTSPEAPYKSLYQQYKGSAALRNMTFDLTMEEFQQLTQMNCSYCNLPPIKEHKRNPTTWILKYTGLDRSDNSKGYTKKNVVPCCATCNYAKKSMTIPQFEDWLSRIHAFFIEKKKA